MGKMISVSVVSLVLWCSQAMAATTPPPGDSEQALSQAMAEATWPADITHLAANYLERYPLAAGAATARRLKEQAAKPQAVLARTDVRLYRRAFAVAASTPQLAPDIHQAALGDHMAAMRMSQAHQRGERGAAKDERLALGWLQYAAVLGNDQAAYDLAVYFRRQDQPAVASQYEALAVALNHPFPTELDHVRK
jgi:TPR repeat protein